MYRLTNNICHMKGQEMKNNYILTYNINAWLPVAPKISFAEKLEVFSNYVKELYGEPAVIMLQEMIAGRGQKFLKVLKNVFSEYEVITPAFDYYKHPQSIMAVTLIRKDILEDYTIEVIDTELPNRVNSVLANLKGIPYRIVNTHMVQVTNFENRAPWYIMERQRLHYEIWKLLMQEAEKNKTENTIIAGDFQERETDSHISHISNMGYRMARTRQATVNNAFFGENHIDHIMFSASAYQKLKPLSIMVDTSEVGRLSDHAMVYAACVS